MSKRVVIEFDKDRESIEYLTEVLKETRVCCNAYIVLESSSSVAKYYERAIQSLLFVKYNLQFPNLVKFVFPKRSKTQYQFGIIDQNRMDLSIRRSYEEDPYRIESHIGSYDISTVTAYDILDVINQILVSEIFDM